MNADSIEQLGTSFDEIFTTIGLFILAIEILKSFFSGRFEGRKFLDMFASISTQIPYLLIEVFIFSSFYLAYEYLAANFVTWTVPITAVSIVVVLLIADFIYYWEHRFAHEVRLFWTQHAVHHSSRFMNITVAVRFGPGEGFLSGVFHLPLVFLGFTPELILFAILAVQAYQTWIHTELIGKLGFLDNWLNTPANHRVHHGCDEKYIDKNYGGILIIWDRLFGTYQKEEETPRYGLATDFESVNPVKVWLSEIPKLIANVKQAQTGDQLWCALFGKPGEFELLLAQANETNRAISNNSKLLP